ncbi:uncharacterized protein LOC117114724 [Anneissia japonica]|uniref:uncharacterized protein LOC117114724 n=1 Tax=Anneissia japonica TaxID=1529436 RepID=UPI0014259BAF|nr:uncharacterized protein LOC117114724 [Anneissia japonica]
MALLRVLVTILTVHSSTKMASGDIRVRSTEDLSVDAVYKRSELCASLRQPLNGGLSCKESSDIRICNLICDSGYNLPDNTHDTFYCDNSDGIWLPSSEISDCMAPNENLCIGLNQPINGLFSCLFLTEER